jgi:hypothetical protein
MTDEVFAVSPAMAAAYAAWDAPADLPEDLTRPQTARVLGLVRSAFMAGWKAHEEFRHHEKVARLSLGYSRGSESFLPRPIWARHGSFAPETADRIAAFAPRVRRMVAGDIGWYDEGGPWPEYWRGPITEAWLFDPDRPIRRMAYGDLFNLDMPLRASWWPWRRWAIVEAHG